MQLGVQQEIITAADGTVPTVTISHLVAPEELSSEFSFVRQLWLPRKGVRLVLAHVARAVGESPAQIAAQVTSPAPNVRQSRDASPPRRKR